MFRKISTILPLLTVISFVPKNHFESERKESRSPTPVISEKLCHYVLKTSRQLPVEDKDPTLQQTFDILHCFFRKINVRDYTDAANFGRNNTLFENPNEFCKRLGRLFQQNAVDVVPRKKGQEYQAVIFNTSGIDGFMERLAFFSRLTKIHHIQTERLIALIGNHTHRKDLQTVHYVLNLPFLFPLDFDLSNFCKMTTLKKIEPWLQKTDWIHKDGMEIAWKLVECDPITSQWETKFHLFNGHPDGDIDKTLPSLRTEQLIKLFISVSISKPITKENPIAFISNAQGAAKTREMIQKIFSKDEGVDLLIARPVEETLEAELFHDTPQQRAMTKLFHFYRILETLCETPS